MFRMLGQYLILPIFVYSNRRLTGTRAEPLLAFIHVSGTITMDYLLIHNQGRARIGRK